MKAFSPYILTFLLSLTLSSSIANGPKGYPGEPREPIEEDYITYYKEGKIIIKKYVGESASITIPNFINNTVVGEIEQYAFYGNTTLKLVNIPAGVQKIGDNAFKHCNLLETVIFQSSELLIGNDAFAECINLKEIITPEGTNTISNYAFSNCKQLSKAKVLATAVDSLFIGYDANTTEVLTKQVSYSFSSIRENTTTTSIGTNKVKHLSVHPIVVDNIKQILL